MDSKRLKALVKRYGDEGAARIMNKPVSWIAKQVLRERKRRPRKPAPKKRTKEK